MAEPARAHSEAEVRQDPATVSVRVYVTQPSRLWLQREAREAGCSVSTLVRMMIVNAERAARD